MKRLTLIGIFVLFSFVNAFANVTMELVGPTDYYVEQAIPYSETIPFPINVDPVTIWVLIKNNGTETFEAIWSGGGMQKTEDSIWLYGGFGGTTPGQSFWTPNSPIVQTSSGFLGISLEPGESFLYDLADWYGIEYSEIYEPASIGSSMTIEYEYINMLSGLDGDPSQEASDIYLYLDKSYTVTVIQSVVPSPTTIFLLGSGLIALVGWHRHIMEKILF